MVTFGVLGPIAIRDEGRELAPTAPKIRLLLAVLLSRTNEIVSSSDLIEELWGQHAPGTAQATLYVYISHLRRLLTALPRQRGDTRLVTWPLGYSLKTSPAEYDVEVFNSLAASGRDALAAGHADLAAGRLRAALDVWRGPAMADVTGAAGPELSGEIVRLEESRMAVLEQRIEADLRLGRHDELVAELQALVLRHPLRENLRGKYMVALYRSGRQSEALVTYRELRRSLVDELGLEPGPQLRAIHQAILSADAELAGPGAPAARSAPAPAAGPLTAPVRGPAAIGQQLRAGAMPVPVRVADFLGRADELRSMREMLRVCSSGPDADFLLTALTGPPGVGKTALAAALTYELASEFPDGHCWVNLRAPTDPLTVQRSVLAALGVEPECMPHTVQAGCELLRAYSVRRRLLVVLNDVRFEAQVRPLYAMTPGSAVVITARRVPAGLEGLKPLALGPLRPEHALDLLRRIIGEERVSAEPDAARDLVRCCGGLPAAIRIAGGRLAVKRHWKISELAGRLGGDLPYLSELCAGDCDLLSVFEQSYADCDEALLTAFSRLGRLPPGPFGLAEAQPALRAGRAAAASLLEQMIDEQLVQSIPGGPGAPRFELHPLLRAYALELAARTGAPPAPSPRGAVSGAGDPAVALERPRNGDRARSGHHSSVALSAPWPAGGSGRAG